MRNLKFIVKDPEHSRKIQEYLFGLGYSWYAGGNCIKHLDMPYLFADADGTMSFSSTEGPYINAIGHESYDIPSSRVSLILKFARSQKC